MKWAILGRLLVAASLLHRPPERGALAELGREVAGLERGQPAPMSAR